MALTWAKHRQLMYGTIVALVILSVGGTYTYFKFFNNAPSCIDNKQNGNEQGIDCGGSCVVACRNQVVAEPILLWSRPFVVANGLTNLAAYLQNPNVAYVGNSVEYLFRVYDKDNVLIGTRIGRVTIPPVKNFVVFEQAFDSGERVPVKAFFEFTEPITWLKFSSPEVEFAVSNTVMTFENTTPRIDSVLENKTINRYQRLPVVALVYDSKGNAIGASRTIVDSISANQSVPLVFTWPNPFSQPESKIEIIPQIPLDQL